jgi:hypothetical protein
MLGRGINRPSCSAAACCSAASKCIVKVSYRPQKTPTATKERQVRLVCTQRRAPRRSVLG